ncbi:MAG: hypothetical protein H0X37_15610 [Herpetosiphonaceae bacterium]|nr:hypothetical protein [Herpetosiphonaceae bacterium]
MNRNDFPSNLDPHDAPTTDLSNPMNQGVDLHDDDPLPDIPAAAPDSQPITSPDPIDFSTKGITGAGAVGMSTFNDGDDQTLFERVTDAFEEGGSRSPERSEQPEATETLFGTEADRRFRVRIYDRPS